jgi:hypothetical protein
VVVNQATLCGIEKSEAQELAIRAVSERDLPAGRAIRIAFQASHSSRSASRSFSSAALRIRPD